MFTRTRRVLTFSLLGLAVVAAGCGDDEGTDDPESPATEEEAPASGSSDSTAVTTTTADSGAGGTATFSTTDGSVPELSFDAQCTPGDTESSFELTGDSTGGGDDTSISASATDGSGTVQLSGGYEFEGTISSAEVGDTGSLSASGDGSIADDQASPTTFTLDGTC